MDASLLDAGKPVDVAALMAAGVIRRALDGVRLLGGGELKAKLALTVNHATARRKAAVEKAGGSITLIEKKVLAGRRGQAQEDRPPRRPRPASQEGGREPRNSRPTGRPRGSGRRARSAGGLAASQE